MVLFTNVVPICKGVMKMRYFLLIIKPEMKSNKCEMSSELSVSAMVIKHVADLVIDSNLESPLNARNSSA